MYLVASAIFNFCEYLSAIIQSPKGTFLCETASYEPSCVIIGFVVFAKATTKIKKDKEKFPKSQNRYTLRIFREALLLLIKFSILCC